MALKAENKWIIKIVQPIHVKWRMWRSTDVNIICEVIDDVISSPWKVVPVMNLQVDPLLWRSDLRSGWTSISLRHGQSLQLSLFRATKAPSLLRWQTTGWQEGQTVNLNQIKTYLIWCIKMKYWLGVGVDGSFSVSNYRRPSDKPLLTVNQQRVEFRSFRKKLRF